MCYRNEGYEVRGKRCGDERRRQPAARVRNYWIGLVASSELACVRGPWRGAACKAATASPSGSVGGGARPDPWGEASGYTQPPPVWSRSRPDSGLSPSNI